MKRLLSLTSLLLALCIPLTACGGAQGTTSTSSPSAESSAADSAAADPVDIAPAFVDGPEIELSFGYSASEETILGMVMTSMARNLEARSNGKITASTYPNGQLGGDTELFESVQSGNLFGVMGAPTVQANYIPELAILDTPFLFRSTDVANKVLSGDYFDILNGYYENANTKLMGISANSFRELSCNKPIYSFEDFAGLMVRTQENKYHMQLWTCLGANPTPLAFSEVYIGLQQGLIQAQENPIDVLQVSKFQEVQDYLVFTHHIPNLVVTVVNKEIYESMPEAYQDLVQQAIDDMYVDMINQYAEKIDGIAKELEDAGMTLIELPDDVHETMRQSIGPVIDEMRNNVGAEAVDDYLAACEAAA